MAMALAARGDFFATSTAGGVLTAGVVLSGLAFTAAAWAVFGLEAVDTDLAAD